MVKEHGTRGVPITRNCQQFNKKRDLPIRAARAVFARKTVVREGLASRSHNLKKDIQMTKKCQAGLKVGQVFNLPRQQATTAPACQAATGGRGLC
jgi:hypothetical protein